MRERMMIVCIVALIAYALMTTAFLITARTELRAIEKKAWADEYWTRHVEDELAECQIMLTNLCCEGGK